MSHIQGILGMQIYKMPKLYFTVKLHKMSDLLIESELTGKPTGFYCRIFTALQYFVRAI